MRITKQRTFYTYDEARKRLDFFLYMSQALVPHITHHGGSRKDS